MLLWVLIGLVAAAVLGGAIALLFVQTKGHADLRKAQETARRARADAETQAKEIVLAAKEESHHIRTSAENEARERQSEVIELERRIHEQEESFLRRLEELEQRQVTLKGAEE